jgi:hypothetical protein
MPRDRAGRQLVVRLNVQRSDSELTDGTGDPAASDHGYRLSLTQTDPPAEEQDWDVVAVVAAVAAEVEYALPFQKEIPLLRKLEREPREIDLLDVFLNLRKVGVDRGIGDETAGQSVFEVETGVRREAVVKRHSGGVVCRQGGDDVRFQFEVHRLRGRFQPDERTGR